jgi:tetratricopeptide (TPR) repeat protein
MTAFKQVLTNLQAGQREEAMIGLEFVLRLDPKFSPAASLKRQLAASAKEIDLGDVIAQLQAPTTDAINTLLIEAVDDFNSREFLAAKDKVERVLVDLPGHPEARELRDQIDKALKIEGQVGQFLVQAREALANGDPQEAANFVMMAQALDPHHTGIATTLKEIDETGGLALSQGTGATQPPARSTDAATGPVSPPAPSAELSPADSGDAYAVEFDTTDPFAGLIDDDGGMPTAEAPADFGVGDGDHAFLPIDDTADLFTAPAAGVLAGGTGADRPLADGHADPGTADRSGHDSVAETIGELIARGQAAMGRGDETQAISSWSRVFLIKPNHPEAGHLIVQAKKRLAENEAEVEVLLNKARDAFDEGEYEASSLLVSRALGLRPNHLAVTMLKEEIERELGSSISAPPGASAKVPATSRPQPGQAPGSRVAAAPPELPQLDDDLFSDLAGTAPGPVAQAVAEAAGIDPTLFSEREDVGLDDFEELSLVDRLRARLPGRLLAIAGAALLVICIGAWLGARFFAPQGEEDDSAAVNELLVEADRRFKEHKVEEALHLLREYPATGLSKQRIDLRIAKYQESLAPPTPTPVPEHASRARSLLDQGLWWSAFMVANDGVKAHPDDAGLQEIRALIIDNEPETAVLDTAIRTRDFRSAVSIAEELVLQYPGQGDLLAILERSLFNAALAESRAYNLTGAENHLVRLLELKPEDEEAARFLEFVQTYKVRAADMRLEIFIRSMGER